MNTILYSEILDEFDVATTKAARIAVLRKHGNRDRRFKEFLNYAFNPKVVFAVPTPLPSYKPALEPAGLTFTNLNAVVEKLYIYVVGHPRRKGKMSDKQTHDHLITTMESLHASESALLSKMFLQDLGVRFLTMKLCKEAFPDLPFDAPEQVS